MSHSLYGPMLEKAASLQVSMQKAQNNNEFSTEQMNRMMKMNNAMMELHGE